MLTIEQIQQDIQDLPEEAQSLLIDFIEILKKRYPKPIPKNQSQEKSLYVGGKIPNGALPKEVRIENNKVYYTLPRNQLQLLDALFHNLENGSALMANLKQGDLTIETSVALNWNDFKLQNLFQLLNLK